ncbi:MAG: putative rane protein [Thermoleophilia bacterium]|nr:putative rane protein [Thermoleophilia bacterium]
MTTVSGDAPRAHAGLGEVALATGAVAAARSIGPTITNPAAKANKVLAGQSAVAGLAAGVAGELVARGVDAATPLDRTQSHLALGVAGAAAMLIGHRLDSNTAKLIGSTGRVLAVTGTIGAALDVSHAKLDEDGDGHFFPEVPWQAELAIGGVVAGGLALKFGPRLAKILKNSKQLGGTATQMDAAGAKLGELIPRSKLTTGPQIFLGSRIQHGHGASAIRTVVPHKLDAPELRTALGLSATGALTSDELASIGIRSLEQQGAFALDDAGKPMVDMILEGSPTGMGGLNIAPVMMSEQLVRTATIDAQYGAKPSVQSLGKVDEAIDQFLAVSKATRDRVALMPEGARPPRVGIATSLGGLQFDDLIAREGHGIIDELGLRKIVTLGAPNRLSKLDAATLPAGFHIRATFDEFAKLPEDQVAKAKFIELFHPDDPVPLISKDLIWRKPEWMPKDRTWVPGVSFLQHATDVTTSISRGTGPKVTHGGHEYREALANVAFARAVGIKPAAGGAFSEATLQQAAVRAQDTAVSEAKRLRDALLGTSDLTKPATKAG